MTTTTRATGGHDVLAADGRIVHIRPVWPDDATALRELYESASERSRQLRFFAAGRGQIDAEIGRLTRPWAADHQAVLAVDSGRVIGVASYERAPGSAEAEFAVLVGDQWQGRGVGTLLLEQLAGYARQVGIVELVGEVLPMNSPMLMVATGLAPRQRSTYESGVVEVRFPTAPDEAALAAMDLRERTAEQHSLRPLLAPAAVAVVGAGRAPHGIGHEVLRSIAAGGFTGRLYAVNPNATEIAGVVSYPSVSTIPEPVDLVVVAVPAIEVEGVLADAGRAGARAAVILSAGFGEEGPEGQAAQTAVVRMARAYHIRLVGPNCLGVLNTDAAVRLAATFAASSTVEPGGLAVASQSGAVGIAILDHAARTGTGISTFVSLGNKADVSGNDLLAYWYDDPSTRAVALYLESFGNPRKFARVARTVARRKPVLAVKSGRSAGGQRAGASHTAAAAAPDTAVDSLFAQAGVIRTDTLGELLDAARLLVDQPLPAGNRLGLVGNAGGVNVLAADAAEAAGLAVPEASVAGGNPHDLGAGATPTALRSALTRLATSGEVDAVIAVFAATLANDPAGTLGAIAAAADDAPDIPFAAVVLGLDDPPPFLGSRRIPVYGLPEQAVRAVGHAAGYAAWRATEQGTRPVLSDVDTARARSIVDDALRDGGGWLPLDRITQLLGCYGIPFIPSTTATTPAEAERAATDLGYPVVLKPADPAIVHKSDRGLVHLDVPDVLALRRAYREIARELGVAQPAVIVQPLRRGGVELVAGVVHDALFGSLIMLGLGGVHTDLLADRAFQLLPVTDTDAAALWRRLRGAPLLTGFRGSEPADTAALEDLLARLGRLAEDLPEVAELDLNPLLAFPHGVTGVDAKLRLEPAGPEPDPTLRILRSAQ